MGRETGRRNCAAGGEVRRTALLLTAALLVAIASPPTPAAAEMLRCASHSLNRQEIADAAAVARRALPSSVHLVATGACWNPHSARVWLETSKVVTPEGVNQWWVVWCQGDESTWTCDAPKFKQAILVTLPVGDETRRVELSFDKPISLERARALTARALAIYGDPTARIPTCSGKDIEKPPSDPHGVAGPLLRVDPIGVTVSRHDTRDSVELEEVYLDFEFLRTEDDSAMQVPCWLGVIVVT